MIHVRTAFHAVLLVLSITSAFAGSTARSVDLREVEGSWALTTAYCHAYLSGKLDKQSEADASWSGLLKIDKEGNIEWAYVAQSCEAKKLEARGRLVKIQAECEYHAVPYKENISIRVKDEKTIDVVFSNKKFPLYGRTQFRKCS
jgi:hypothetical protein